jgi:NAD(P)-dependent dehydrogenase (short-subunit alcohol dehydrogenase family)
VGKLILITGSTDGIGKQTALELARLGHHVIIHGRDPERGRRTVEEIQKLTAMVVSGPFIADFSSLHAVRELSRALQDQFRHLDVLINNAGMYPKGYERTEEGLERTFVVNHLSHFLLTNLLIDLLLKVQKPRIVTVSSMVHARHIDFDNLQGEKSFESGSAYSLSKLCNILFTYRLARDFRERGLTANCLHPGVVNTKLLHVAWSMTGAPVEEGCRTSVYLAQSPEVGSVSGAYFVNLKPAQSAPLSYDRGVQDRLWEISDDLTGACA